ncbi:ABC transporter ATP-binding protein [Chitinophagaceae bacterium MMS25-I14]
MTPVIETNGLVKRFGNFTAVEDLSFSIQPGDVYGFLGENGAGKSTTMRMLLGLVKPDAGKVMINGEVLAGTKRHLMNHIGAIIEQPDMYGYLSGWDNLRMFATLSRPGIPDKRLYDVLELTGLRGREKDKVKAYSQGMKQRLGIAIALVHDPDLLILDEPTNGLDPQGIAEMRVLIQRLSRDHGKTILISSHLLYEIEQVANRMLIIHKGRKMVEGSVKELLDPAGTLMEIHWQQNDQVLQALLQSQWKAYVEKTEPGLLTFKMHPGQMPQLNIWLAGQGALITEIRARHSLEAYFLSLTQ